MARQGLNKISMIASAKLINLIEAEYATSGLTDKAFAEHATMKLGFDIIESHVRNRRQEMGIESNRDLARVASRADIGTLQDLIATLERRVTKLEFEMADVQNPRPKLATR